MVPARTVTAGQGPEARRLECKLTILAVNDDALVLFGTAAMPETGVELACKSPADAVDCQSFWRRAMPIFEMERREIVARLEKPFSEAGS